MGQKILRKNFKFYRKTSEFKSYKNRYKNMRMSWESKAINFKVFKKILNAWNLNWI